MVKNQKFIIYDVSCYSQHLDVVDSKWADISCGIVSLKMVMETLSRRWSSLEIPSIDDLVKEGAIIENKRPKYGWKHDTLVMVARNHGFHAYGEVFKSFTICCESGNENRSEHEGRLTEGGIKKIIEFLTCGNPVMVSVSKKLEENGSPHIVLLTGFERGGNGVEGFYYNDPDSHNRKHGENRFVSIDDFKKVWRKMAIFVYTLEDVKIERR